MKFVYDPVFKRQFDKIKNNKLRVRITNKLKKLRENPFLGKPLRYSAKNHRSLRIGKYRIIYRIEDDKILILCFDHRKLIYEELLILFYGFFSTKSL